MTFPSPALRATITFPRRLLSHNRNTPPTPSQIANANLLIPRLILHSRLPEAVTLTTTLLAAGAAPSSLSLPVLLSHLASHPSPLSLLPPQSPLSLPLLFALFSARRPVLALQLFHRINLKSRAEGWDGVVVGLCGSGMVREGLGILGERLGRGVEVGEEVRCGVRRALLGDARVEDAVEVEGVLMQVRDGGDRKKAAEVIERIVREWTDW